MYKSLILFSLLTSTLNCFAQTSSSKSSNVIPGQLNITIGSNESRSLFGLNIIEYGRGQNNSGDNDIDGSIYLFKNWNNQARIWLEDKIFNLDMINYNIRYQRFEIKLKNDSLLIVDPARTKIEKVLINNRLLKPYYDKDLDRETFFEVIWQAEDYSLLSNYTLSITSGAQDPMTKIYTIPKKYSHNHHFYLKNNGDDSMTLVKLKKSVVLKLIDEQYVDEVKRFAKKRRLKFKRADDVKDILTYYKSIKS